VPVYKPQATIVLLLTATLALLLVLELVFGVQTLYFVHDQGTFLARVEAGELGPSLVALLLPVLELVWRGVSLLSVVLILVWVYDANRNARALGAEGMSYTPGWSVAWFFIPLASLLVPHFVVMEIYQASHPTASKQEWRKTLVPLTIRFWWLLWILSAGLTQVATVWDSRSEEVADTLRLVSAPLGILASGFGILLVRGIHARQEARLERLQREKHDRGEPS
jgi:hypothetical protein